ncbi:MAG: glycogen debranching N-terminal domain-containing protein [Kibdelosporangium sp.]
MSGRTLVRGTTFLLAGEAGDVATGTEGFYVDDTRHLSGWELEVDAGALRLLGSESDGHATQAVLTPATCRGHDPAYTVFRGQAVDTGILVEQLRVRSHLREPSKVTISYRLTADFADQFELRGSGTYEKPGAQRERRHTDEAVTFTYERGDYRKWTTLRASQPPTCAGDRVSWTLDLPPLGETLLGIQITTGQRSELVTPAEVAERARADAAHFLSGVTLPDVAWPGLRAAVDRGLSDLADLRVPAPGRPELRIPGAGVPWFLTLFGRDSLITAMSVLPYLPDLAADTLRALAATQGTVVDPGRVEEPGKIVHEVRQGELSLFGQTPYDRYYGTVDATPLFLMLLGRHRRLAGDTVAIELEQPARAAVDWMFRYGGLDEHGYLVYRTDGPGLVHQCWKDSARSICYASGELAEGPIAVCEAQGYAYEALSTTADIARAVWDDPVLADRLLRRANRLRAEFEADFWLPEQEFVALALDGRRRQVDVLASNAGHVLWSGILASERAEAVGRRLAGPEFFSGWGIRTLAAGQVPYHPVSYHNGGVWPHDTAIAVAGLAGTGLTAEAERVAVGLVDAAAHQPGNRLPEVLTGYSRGEVGHPVRYPHSSSPQAWAAAAPLLIATGLDIGLGTGRT